MFLGIAFVLFYFKMSGLSGNVLYCLLLYVFILNETSINSNIPLMTQQGSKRCKYKFNVLTGAETFANFGLFRESLWF